MVVTLEGMVTLVKLVHHSNALSPMVVTPSGITIDVIFLGHLTKVLLSELKRTPCDLSFAISSVVELESSENVDVLLVLPREGMITLVHSGNALCPIFVTREGMVTLVKFVQPENAYPLMILTLEGMVTLVKFEHLQNALSPMVITLSGMVTLVRLLQP